MAKQNIIQDVKYCSGVTLCVTLCVTCYVNNMHARCPYKTHLRFIQAECEVSNG